MSARNKRIAKSMSDTAYGRSNPAYSGDFSRRKRHMKFNRVFADKRVFTTVYAACALAILGLLLFAIYKVQNFSTASLFQNSDIDMGGFFTETDPLSFMEVVIKWKWVIAIYLIIAVIGYIRFAYLVRVSFSEINIGQKGTEKWADRDDLKKQMKWIPEAKIRFNGMGGIPLAREGNTLGIDDSNTNSMVIGTTRSGKGQMIVNPMIDIISRAEEQCSMVVTDPKLELANMAIPKLQERGYECHLINLVDPKYSTAYNPLSVIIDEYLSGDIATAQLLCQSLGYAFFTPAPGESDPYFINQARNVFVAAVMADIEDNVVKDEKENRRKRYRHEKEEDEKERAYYKKLYGNEYTYYELYKLLGDVLKYAKYVSKDEEHIAYEDIYEVIKSAYDKEVKRFNDQMPLKIDLHTIEYIANIQNDLDAATDNFKIVNDEVYFANYDFIYKKWLDPVINFKEREGEYKREPFVETHENIKKTNIHSVYKFCNALQSEKIDEQTSKLDEYFAKRDEDDFARIVYGAVASATDKTKGTILSSFSEKLTIFSYENIAKMTAESSFSFTDIGFGKKPVAIFIGLPDYDPSTWAIATTFINQMYFILAKYATAMPGGKLNRRVHFILDEFGNLPAIDNMDNIITVCLGRQMVFTFFIQSFAQLDAKYEKGAKTILDNCGNQIFIKTTDENTAEEFSTNLGNETIITVNRTGKKLSINKEMTEMVDQRRLLDANELMGLEEGECVVRRTMKRTDNKGRAIKADPIANLGEHRLKYAYQFLSDTFPQGQQLYKSDNYDKITGKIPGMQTTDLKIIDVGLRNNSNVILSDWSRSAKSYLEYADWREETFNCKRELTGRESEKKYRVFLLLNLDQEEISMYESAGEVMEDGEIINEDKIIKNYMLEEYADMLINANDKDLQEKGHELLNEILTLEGEENINIQTEEQDVNETDMYILRKLHEYEEGSTN